jgi:hypothetical protein
MAESERSPYAQGPTLRIGPLISNAFWFRSDQKGRVKSKHESLENNARPHRFLVIKKEMVFDWPDE